MIESTEYHYKPHPEEQERATNSYLMSLVVVIFGMPLPIVNLLASVIYYLGNMKASSFVRWHCVQVMLTQLFLFFINSVGFIWLMFIIFGNWEFTNYFIAYVLILLAFNISELVGTILSVLIIKRGKHPKWWIFGDLTDIIMAEDEQEERVHG
ncbi:MAG: hypothetical protein EA409_02820 [Saprospirales bacterium]|nr:MAG: hypothetical protein EA409_02820 [Saprospirales bacterium]